MNRLPVMLALALLLSHSSYSSPTLQAQLGPSVQECGTVLRAQDVQRATWLQGQGAYSLQFPPPPSSVVNVSIAMHIVRASNGTGGLPASGVAASIAALNAAYLPMGIQFSQLGQIDYINSDDFYSNINTTAEINALRLTNVAANAVNVYFTNTFANEGGGLNGISSFTYSPVQGIVMRNSVSGSSTVVHELGHYFDLFHTHEMLFGTECPNGSNCSTSGDLICDTPADPNVSGQVNGSCVYTGGSTLCSQAANPQTANFMSYSSAACRTLFTGQQNSRGIAALLNLRPELAQLPATNLVNLSSAGFQDPDDECPFSPVGVSEDGRYVAFLSSADQLSPLDVNHNRDAYRRDTMLGITNVVSVTTNGQASALATGADDNDLTISADGNFVAFASGSGLLVAGDTNGQHDVFRRDMTSGTTILVSRSAGANGQLGNAWSGRRSSAVSGDGRYVAFDSLATNLVGRAVTSRQVYLRDCTLHQTELVSVSDVSSVPGNGECYYSAVSADARYVAFASEATNLVPNDTNALRDVFVRDRLLARTHRISISTLGVQSDGVSDRPAVSSDGRFVAFETQATNLTSINGGVVVHDLILGTTRSVHVPLPGFSLLGDGIRPSISADGRCITFASGSANNYVPGASNGYLQVLMFDQWMTTTSLLSVGPSGAPGTGDSNYPRISGDCRAVAFTSQANDLVLVDSNGILGDVLERPTGVSNPPYRAFCAGDGSVADCPCNNHSPLGQFRGCKHSVGIGARLVASGVASLGADTLVLTGSSQPAGTMGLYFQGTAAAASSTGVQFGDGLMCLDGTIVRLGVKSAPTGSSSFPAVGDPTISVQGFITSAPTIRMYQLWYRDAVTFCTASTFNLTNGSEVQWVQ